MALCRGDMRCRGVVCSCDLLCLHMFFAYAATPPADTIDIDRDAVLLLILVCDGLNYMLSSGLILDILDYCVIFLVPMTYSVLSSPTMVTIVAVLL